MVLRLHRFVYLGTSRHRLVVWDALEERFITLPSYAERSHDAVSADKDGGTPECFDSDEMGRDSRRSGCGVAVVHGKALLLVFFAVVWLIIVEAMLLRMSLDRGVLPLGGHVCAVILGLSLGWLANVALGKIAFSADSQPATLDQVVEASMNPISEMVRALGVWWMHAMLLLWMWGLLLVWAFGGWLGRQSWWRDGLGYRTTICLLGVFLLWNVVAVARLAAMRIMDYGRGMR